MNVEIIRAEMAEVEASIHSGDYEICAILERLQNWQEQLAS